MDKKTYFVTGTDTNIGKTMASSLLAGYFHKQGYKTIYYKPIETGAQLINGKFLPGDVEFVKNHNPFLNKYETEFMNTCLFQLPASPHLASAEENITIDIKRIFQKHEELKNEFDIVIIEGAGGIMVPLNKNYLLLDLIKKIDSQVILVSASKLGTINHTLMSLKILENEEIKTAGVIINRYPEQPGIIEKDNLRSIEKYGQTRILATIKNMDDENKYSDNLLELRSEFKI